MDFRKVNFEQLSSEYSDPESLQCKKLQIVDSYIQGGALLDVGMGTDEHSRSPSGWRGLIEGAGFKVTSVETVKFPILRSEYLRKNLCVLGKGCIIVTSK